jgi:hypothetical protein
MSKSVSYRPSLIERLQQPEYAAAFLTAVLEEANPEPELLESALIDVAEALNQNGFSIKAEANQELREEDIAASDYRIIYYLQKRLNLLSLKLAIVVKDESVNPQIHFQSILSVQRQPNYF